jgi:hypothetical protein
MYQLNSDLRIDELVYGIAGKSAVPTGPQLRAWAKN